MRAYFQGRAFQYLTNSINCLWIEQEHATLFVRYEVVKDGIRVMDFQQYEPAYRPWEVSSNFSAAPVAEVRQVIMALRAMVKRLMAGVLVS